MLLWLDPCRQKAPARIIGPEGLGIAVLLLVDPASRGWPQLWIAVRVSEYTLVFRVQYLLVGNFTTESELQIDSIPVLQWWVHDICKHPTDLTAQTERLKNMNLAPNTPAYNTVFKHITCSTHQSQGTVLFKIKVS